MALTAERAAVRLEFVTTAAAVRISEYEAGRTWGTSGEDRSKLLLRTEAELRAAIDRLRDCAVMEDLHSVEEQDIRFGPASRLVPEPRQSLLINASVVLGRIERLRKQQ
jgi:hypothetical protein